MRRRIAFVATVVAGCLGVMAFTAAAEANVEKLIANFTGQCTSPAVCGTEFLGGEWGHGVFLKDTSTGSATGEIEVAFAFHNVQGSGPLQATSHLKTHVTSWSVGFNFPGAGVPDIVFDNYYSTFTGGTGLFTDGVHAGPPFDSAPCFLGCPLETEIPAAPGHWKMESFFGVDRLPGFTYEAQVVEVR